MRVCYFLSHYRGHLEAGQQLAGCLRRLGVEVVHAPAGADAVVVHDEIGTLPGYVRMHPGLRGGRLIAHATWETSRLPEHLRVCLGLAGEVWTCSTYCRDVLAQAGRPVSLVPPVVCPPAPDPAAQARVRARLGVREGEFLFYTVLTSAANVRKGLSDLVGAFGQAFPGGEARLVVKTTVPLPAPLAAAPGVTPLAERLPPEEMAALHAVGHCCVSAHRSEAWGLPLSDAMAAGRLVVATAHGGNLDFMNEGNSLPVACAVEPIRPDEAATQADVLDTGMRWGYVDVDDLARQMRRAFEEYEALAPLREQARRDMAAYAPDRVAEVLAARLAAG